MAEEKAKPLLCLEFEESLLYFPAGSSVSRARAAEAAVEPSTLSVTVTDSGPLPTLIYRSISIAAEPDCPTKHPSASAFAETFLTSEVKKSSQVVTPVKMTQASSSLSAVATSM